MVASKGLNGHEAGGYFREKRVKSSCIVLFLTLLTDRLFSLFDLSERNGSDVASME